LKGGRSPGLGRKINGNRLDAHHRDKRSIE
jgi:hypothetical protein